MALAGQEVSVAVLIPGVRRASFSKVEDLGLELDFCSMIVQPSFRLRRREVPGRGAGSVYFLFPVPIPSSVSRQASVKCSVRAQITSVTVK